MNEAIKALAEYFSGPSVGIHSMGLQMEGMNKIVADRFFAVRTACGISGYVTAEEAAEAIKRRIEPTHA